MYIINVIPLTKIPRPNPQILSYFFSKKLTKGALVQISLRRKKINAIVISSENLKNKKIDIKKGASFKLKPVEKVISKEPALNKSQLKLLSWISEYYFVPLGLVARIFLSKKLPVYIRSSLILTPEIKKLVFSPFKNLKSITVENADSPRYQSWGRKPYYNAQKIALQLAKIFKAKIVLKSNLPCVETYYLAKQKKYKLAIQEIQSPAEDRISKDISDLREQIKKGNYSILSKELQEKIKKYKKAIFYIPRRGTASVVLCRDCGYVLKCPNCEVSMVYHQGPKLLCHHCGVEQKPPVLCPNCQSYRIKYFGVGTQKVEIEIKKLFPQKKVLRLDSDTAKTPAEQQKIINRFHKLKNAILIGTQMLFEKNIKPADLVAIISIETILNLPDYRSSERVFRIINQLKKMTKKYFLVQTYNPENFAIKTVIDNNWKKFYTEELKIRKTLNYPPFSQIIKLTFEHKNSQKAKQEAKILFEKLKIQINNFFAQDEPAPEWQLLGPVPAFIPRVAGKYRWNIIIKSKIKNLKKRNKLLIIVPSTWEVEVDPDSLL